MTDGPAILVLDEDGPADYDHTHIEQIIGLNLCVQGEHVTVRVGLAHRRARLADIVPLARAVCEKITDRVLRQCRTQGGSVPCRPGCAACCHYLVPLSVPEAFRLAEEVLEMPESRRRLAQRSMLLTAKHVLERKMPQDFVDEPAEPLRDSDDSPQAISNWYRDLSLGCPFLDNGMCGIYALRPLACREHFVNGCRSACGDRCAAEEVVKVPVRTTEVLGQLAAELEGTTVEAVMLPLVTVWYENNIERNKQTRPSEMMVKRFGELVENAAHEDYSVLTRPV